MFYSDGEGGGVGVGVGGVSQSPSQNLHLPAWLRHSQPSDNQH